MMSILKTTPSSITVQFGDKTVKVLGESFIRGHGSPDFIININSIETWKGPMGDSPVSEAERSIIVDYLLRELTMRNWAVIAE